jgi:hypothetical protein
MYVFFTISVYVNDSHGNFPGHCYELLLISPILSQPVEKLIKKVSICSFIGWTGKGKIRPVTDPVGPEGDYRCSSTLSLALDGVGSLRHTPTALPPGKRPAIHFTGGRVGPRAGQLRKISLPP